MSADIAQAKAAVSIVRLIGETLKLERDGKLLVGLCPFHGERTPSFYVYPDHYHCFGCGAHGDAIEWLQRAHRMSFADAVAYLRGEPAKQLSQVSPAVVTEAARASTENTELARRLWCDAIGAHGSIVERYLEHRGGLRLPDAPVIRFHPACPRKRPEPPLPAMVSLMVDPVTGAPCGVHRTFLLADGAGKADTPKAKMMLGQAGVVRLVNLQEVGEGLGVAEGIETALTVTQRIGWGPVWAACSAGMLAKFPVLPCTALNVFADADDTGAGLKAARECAQRWAAAGAEALIHIPPDGTDWADAAVRLP